LTFFHGKLLAGGGLRFDQFRFDIKDRVDRALSGLESAGRWQPKGSLAYTPSPRLPLTFYANYGRGISTSDARAVVQYPGNTRIATTDFYQLGTSYRHGRFSTSADLFWIDRSNEQVYIPDDGTFEFKGPSRAYGFETKASVEITHKLTLNGGVTKVANAFYRGALQRIYVDSAPHFVANAGLTVSSWKGWSGSLRMRAINHYRLDGEDPSIIASGHTVLDFGLSRRIRRGVEFNFAVDNLTNRDYYETQNYFASRLPAQPPISRIHVTPGYPLTATVGMTFRLRGK
jgi:outer membrane receptor protein involved in Fe transport